MPVSRRTFLGSLAAAIPVGVIVRRAHALAVDDLAASPRTLRALGEAVLPSELGSAGVAAAVDRFQRWIAGYREGAELLHGYGTSTLEKAGPTPATKWAAQLARLDAKLFADLPLEQRRAMIRAELAVLKVDRIGSVGRAPHIAVALLAHFYASPEATDLCYQAKIGKQTCRPLATSSRQPLPLA
jgi:anti-sigma factor RsiW